MKVCLGSKGRLGTKVILGTKVFLGTKVWGFLQGTKVRRSKVRGTKVRLGTKIWEQKFGNKSPLGIKHQETKVRESKVRGTKVLQPKEQTVKLHNCLNYIQASRCRVRLFRSTLQLVVHSGLAWVRRRTANKSINCLI